MQSLIPKSDFIGLEDAVWFYSGAETPPHVGCAGALNDYIASRALGPRGRERNAATERSCKRQIGEMIGAREEDIAILSNSSEIISMISLSLGLEAGDNVVINTLEFPSGVLPWLALRERGVEVRVVRDRDWEVAVADIMSQVDARTRLVVTSHVSYISGARLDPQALYEQLQPTGALLLLDATQSLGVVPVRLADADFIVCSSYKWLLSVHGYGLLAVNPRRVGDFRPCSAGWRSVSDMFSPNRFESYTLQPDARRFELGYPSYPSLYTLAFSSRLLLDVGIERIEAHVAALGTYLIERLQALGFAIMTPVDPAKRAGNISIAYPGDAEAFAARLLDRGIYVWGGDGRFRVSIHLFNDSGDIDRLLETLPACMEPDRQGGGA
ncbi:aminotransferase class V-fold PLP-dependent enzyme [Paenibacillus cymbidii]|uniref:aminotransferase class V-fold PLP-dependent enzyme n=1 Tax=Paenibacillus cymbidii TaxID=1639034 RepID=UPI001081621A|nr:aminotransferase class V-fold PLP-dependent enzyme [Paenibacillus cymbidii]